jgi:excisionase family DNA binding protein
MHPDHRLALRPKDAARALSISERHLWQLTHDGAIPCTRIGSGKRKTVLYSKAALEDWLRSSNPDTQPLRPTPNRPDPGFSSAKY